MLGIFKSFLGLPSSYDSGYDDAISEHVPETSQKKDIFEAPKKAETEKILSIDVELPKSLPAIQIKEAAVIGAGPAGFAAALTLKANGYHVTIHEQRNLKSLDIHLNLRDVAVKTLKDLKVDLTFERSIATLKFLDEIANTKTTIIPVLQESKTFEPAIKFLMRPSCYQVTLSELVAALRVTAAKNNISIITHTSVSLEQEKQNYSIKSGDIVRPYDFIIVADGAHGKISEQLDIKKIIPPKRDKVEPKFITGLVKHNVGSSIFQRKFFNEYSECVYHTCVGHLKNGNSWLLLEMSPKEILQEKELSSFFRKKAGELLERTIESSDVLFGGTKLTTVHQWRLATTAVSNTFFIGDATRAYHFSAAGGVNLILGADIQHLSQALQQIQQGKALEKIRETYHDNLTASSEAWEIASRQYFESPLKKPSQTPLKIIIAEMDA